MNIVSSNVVGGLTQVGCALGRPQDAAPTSLSILGHQTNGPGLSSCRRNGADVLFVCIASYAFYRGNPRNQAMLPVLDQLQWH